MLVVAGESCVVLVVLCKGHKRENIKTYSMELLNYIWSYLGGQTEFFGGYGRLEGVAPIDVGGSDNGEDVAPMELLLLLLL